MNSPVVLVIEDDVPVRNLIVTTLKTHDYRYLTAKNGSEAIMMASSHNPDVLFLDLGLPDMDGIDVIRQVRSWSDTPIIVISARSDDADNIEPDSDSPKYIQTHIGIGYRMLKVDQDSFCGNCKYSVYCCIKIRYMKINVPRYILKK